MTSSKKCCVPGCWESGRSDKTLHPFPNPKSDRDRFNSWVFVVGGDILSLDNELIYKKRRVCRAHFEEKYLCRNYRISNIAMPTLNLRGFMNVSRSPQVDRRPLKSIQYTPKPVPSNSADLQYIFHLYEDESKKNIDCEENGTTEVNLSQSQQGLQLFDGDAVEDVPDAGDIHSDNCDKETEGNQFSWQKSTQICIDDDEFDEVPHVPALDIEVDQAEEKPKDTISEDHKEYFCDSCTNSIVGPRYRCVECDNYDLCSRCEARHARHYMLRIPRPRPFSEIKIIIDAIREKLKGFSEELPQNSLELDEIKQEPDFIDPAALDPLSTRPHADEAADTSQCVPQSPPPITQRSETTIRKIAPDDNLSKTERRKVTAVDNVTVTSLSDVTYKAPRVTSLATNNRPIYVISHNATQKRPKVTQLKGTFKNVQTAPTVVDPKVTLKQVDLIKDNEKPHKDGNTSKQMLATFVEKSFKRNQVFKDMEETLKHCFANISDGDTRGKGFKRKNSDLEETWLDEELLAEDIDSSEEDCEETPATRVTRSATKSKKLTDENAPDT